MKSYCSLLNSYLWSYVWPPNLPLLLSSLAPPRLDRSPINSSGCWGHPERMPRFGTTNGGGRKGDRGEEGKQHRNQGCFFVVLGRTFCFACPWELWSTSENRVCASAGLFWCTAENTEEHLWLHVLITIWVWLLSSSKAIIRSKLTIPVTQSHCKLKAYSLIYACGFTAQMPPNVQSVHIWRNLGMTVLDSRDSSSNTDRNT